MRAEQRRELGIEEANPDVNVDKVGDNVLEMPICFVLLFNKCAMKLKEQKMFVCGWKRKYNKSRAGGIH